MNQCFLLDCLNQRLKWCKTKKLKKVQKWVLGSWVNNFFFPEWLWNWIKLFDQVCVSLDGCSIKALVCLLRWKETGGLLLSLSRNPVSNCKVQNSNHVRCEFHGTFTLLTFTGWMYIILIRMLFTLKISLELIECVFLSHNFHEKIGNKKYLSTSWWYSYNFSQPKRINGLRLECSPDKLFTKM